MADCVRFTLILFAIFFTTGCQWARRGDDLDAIPISTGMSKLSGRDSGATLANDAEPKPELSPQASDDSQADSKLKPASDDASSTSTAALTLDRAIQLALAQNPDLKAAAAQEAVSQNALGVAKAYPYSPTAAIEVVPSPQFSGGGVGKTKYQIALTQTLELTGQSQYRATAGRAQLNRTRCNIQMVAVATVAETERRYFQVRYRRELLKLTQSTAELNEHLLGVLERQFTAGKASAADVSLARIETRASQQQAALALAQYTSAEQALRIQLGLPPQELVELEGIGADGTWSQLAFDFPLLRFPENNEQTEVPPGVDIDAEVNHLAASRPDVLAADADVCEAQAQWQLAQANLTPNLLLGPKYERDESDSQFWGLMAEMNFGKRCTSQGNPLIRQQYAEYQRRRIVLDQLVLKATLEIEAAAQRCRQAQAAVALYDQEARSSVTADVATVADLFEAGQVDLINVFAARKAALQLGVSRAEALNELGQAVAELTVAAGRCPEVGSITVGPSVPDGHPTH